MVDLTDPARPELIGVIPLTNDPVTVCTHNIHAYLLTEAPGSQTDLRVIDISDPRFPVEVTSLHLDFEAWRLEPQGDRVYVIGFNEGVIVDITTPPQSAIVARFPFYGPAGVSLALNDDVATMSGWLFTRRDDSWGITDVPQVAPRCLLEPPRPNPFNPSTTVAFSVSRAADLTLSVHDLKGRQVAELVQGRFQPGRHMVEWNGRDAAGRNVASGVYLMRLHGDGVEASRTATLIK